MMPTVLIIANGFQVAARARVPNHPADCFTLLLSIFNKNLLEPVSTTDLRTVETSIKDDSMEQRFGGTSANLGAENGDETRKRMGRDRLRRSRCAGDDFLLHPAACAGQLSA